MNSVKVPFLDLNRAYAELAPELDLAYGRVMRSGRYLLGDEAEQFEKSFAQEVGSKYCVGVASGLDALVLSLKALQVGPEDEVIVPSHTFIATWLAVSAVGATVVPVEPDPATYCITPEGIASAITPKTAAIIPVHLYGLPCEMREIEALAQESDIPVIADAAQAHGATLGDFPVGSFGDASAWSFYPGKNLGAFADAGAITTNSSDLADRLRTLRNYGSRVKYVHDERGFNSRLDEMQAAFLSVKLGRLSEWNARRRSIADRYLQGLSEVPLILPKTLGGRTSSWHLFVIRTERRDELQRHLGTLGIETLIHYPVPGHRQGAYREAFRKETFPIVEEMSKSILSLPIGPHMTDEEVEHTTDAVLKFFA